MSAFKNYFTDTITKRYADFSGRASRSEYWFFGLFFILIIFAILILVSIIVGLTSSSSAADLSSDNPLVGLGTSGKILLALLVIFMVALTIPWIALTVRRLHDIGRSGWWYLIRFIPLGGLVLFVFSVLESEPGRNKWGPNPWEVDDERDDISQHLIEDYDKL